MGHKVTLVAQMSNIPSSNLNRQAPVAISHSPYTSIVADGEFREPGVLSGFRARMVTNNYTSDGAFEMWKNGNKEIDVSLPAGNTGVQSDLSTAVAIASSDIAYFNLLRGSANSSAISYFQIGYKVNDKNKTVLKYNASGSMGIGGSISNFPITGLLSSQAEDDALQVPIKVACTAKFLSVKISSSNTNGATEYRLRDGSSDAIVLSVPASTTGRITNVSDTYSLTTSSKVSFSAQRVTGSTGVSSTNVIAIDFEYTGDSVQYISNTSAEVTLTRNQNTWFAPMGGFYIGGNNTLQECYLFESGKVKDMSVYIKSSATSANTFFTMQLNGSDTSLVVTAGAGVTGQLDNTTDDFAFSDGDRVIIKSHRTSGTQAQVISWFTWVCEYDPLPSVFNPAIARRRLLARR